MKILFYTKYTRRGASSRLRSYQYFPVLEAQGAEVAVSPFFDDEYLERLYSGKSTVIQAAKAYLRRFCALFKALRYDRIVIEKELFPYFPAWAEALFNLLKIRYAVDYDDAIFHNYDLSANRLIRFSLKNKIDKVMKYSDLVVAGNSYLAERAVQAGAGRVVIRPTVVDLPRYKVKEVTEHQPVIIGWIGSQSTMKYLFLIKDVLRQLIDNYGVKIHIVGASQNLGLGENELHFAWSETTETELIQGFDIGVMPLADTPWEKGKCAYKLIQYMACGLPVVASAVGMNCDVVRPDCGYLAETEREWYQALERFVTDAEARRSAGKAGRRVVEEGYCLEIQDNLYC